MREHKFEISLVFSCFLLAQSALGWLLGHLVFVVFRKNHVKKHKTCCCFLCFSYERCKKKQNGLPVVESCVSCCNLAALGRHERPPALTVCKVQFAQKRNSPRVRFGIERSVSSTLVGERVFARTQIRNLTRLLLLFACAKRSRTALGASWGFLGRSWVLLGPLGRSLGASWVVLGTS